MLKWSVLYKKYGGLHCLPNVCPMSAKCQPNVCPMSAKCLPSVPNFCLMSHMSAKCPHFLPGVLSICPMSHISAQSPQFLPNVVRGQISDFFRYVLTCYWRSQSDLILTIVLHCNVTVKMAIGTNNWGAETWNLQEQVRKIWFRTFFDRNNTLVLRISQCSRK